MAVKSFTEALLVGLALAGCGNGGKPAPKMPAAATSAGAQAGNSEPEPVPSAGEQRPDIAFRASEPLNLTSIDAMLASIAGEGRGLSAADFLLKLGFDDDSVAPLARVDVNEARRMEDNLDAEPDLESMILVDAVLPGDNPNAPGRQVYLVWVEPGPPLKVIGRKRFAAESCGTEGSIDVTVRPVHSPAFADTLVVLETSIGCDRASSRTAVFTIERGKLEALLDVNNVRALAPESGKPAPKLDVTLVGNPPQRAEIRDDKKRIRKQLAFDARSFSYR